MLVGAGSQYAELRQFAAGTSGRVRVLDAVPHEQVPDILAAAHVGVLPFADEPKWRVSSPVKLFEYMAAGMPILATRIVCHTDVIGDGKFAFWSEPEDFDAALTRLWQARATLEEAGRQASDGVAGWTWRDSAAHLKAALEHGLATYD
jgi:glycosyltransferase involved in cell wall biosynthesis